MTGHCAIDAAGAAGLLYAVPSTENNPRGILADPIWDHIQVGGAGCWEWTAGRNVAGYGRFKRGGTVYLAHRFVATLLYGPLDSKTHVCHACDNPPCCRPDHLFLGTAKDNVRDMVKKRRHNPKNTLYRSWLQAQAVPLARLYQTIGSYHKIARMLHVCHRWLQSILQPIVDATPTRFGGVTPPEYADRRKAGLMWCSACNSWQPDNGSQSYCRPCCREYSRQRQTAQDGRGGIKVHHRGPGDHLDCVPKLLLTCATHRGGVAYCWVPDAEIEADRLGRWICDPCLSVGAL